MYGLKTSCGRKVGQQASMYLGNGLQDCGKVLLTYFKSLLDPVGVIGQGEVEPMALAFSVTVVFKRAVDQVRQIATSGGRA